MKNKMDLIQTHKEIQKIEMFKYFLERDLSLRMVVTSPTMTYINAVRVDFVEDNLRPIISFDMVAAEDIRYLYVSFINIRNKVQQAPVNDSSLYLVITDLLQDIKKIETLYGDEIASFEASSDYQQYLNSYEDWLLSIQSKFNTQLISTLNSLDSVDKQSYEYSYIKYKLFFMFSNPLAIDVYLNNLMK